MSDEFYKAVDYVNQMKDTIDVSDHVKEELYGLYKRVTVGKCSENGGTRPSFLNVIGRRKYDAWMRNDTTSEEDCIKKYIVTANRLKS
mgnify:FL=1